MKHIHTALFATALCALVATPALAGDPVLPADQYVKYAKVLNGAAPAETTNVVKEAVSEVVKTAGDKAQQATGEIAAALAAVSTFKGEKAPAAAAAIFENVVAAASAAGSDKAEKLGLAKIAAAAGAFVSDGADYVDGAGAGLAKNVAKEIKAALENAREVLADVDVDAIKSVYDAALTALRGGSYKMKEDDDSVGAGGEAAAAAGRGSGGAGVGSVESALASAGDEFAPGEAEVPVSFESAETGSDPERVGIYTGTTTPAPVPPKKAGKVPVPVPVPPKKEPKNETPTGLV